MSSSAEPTLNMDSQRQRSDKFSIPISRSLTLDVYSSTKPHNMKIADLHKGLIVTCNGKERVGEGTGFGFPVLVCPKETIFSGSANVRISKTSEITKIVKEFHMDRVCRNKLGNLRLENQRIRTLMKHLAGLYQQNKHFRSLLFRQLISNLGVEVAFEKTEPVGNISVTYELNKNFVDIQVDLSQIETQYKKGVFILNEQSAGFFRKYSDSHNTILLDDKVGAWDSVNAEFASLTDIHDRFGFRVWQAESALLRRGRETMQDYLDWVGLDYELSPKMNVFKYRVELLGSEC